MKRIVWTDPARITRRRALDTDAGQEYKSGVKARVARAVVFLPLGDPATDQIRGV